MYPSIIFGVIYELFRILSVFFKKFCGSHPDKIIDLAWLRYKMFRFLVGKRYFVRVVIFVVKIRPVVQNVLMGCFKEVFEVFDAFFDSHLFAEFAYGGIAATVACTDVPRAASIEQVRVVLLEMAPELEYDSAMSVECPNMDCPVPKAFCVDFGSASGIPSRGPVAI